MVQTLTKSKNPDVSDVIKSMTEDPPAMTKAERKRLVLQFMEEHPLALTPKLLFRNLKLHRGITFGEASVLNYLQELDHEGLIVRVKKEELDNGKIVEADKDDRAYYIITDAGRDSLRDE